MEELGEEQEEREPRTTTQKTRSIEDGGGRGRMRGRDGMTPNAPRQSSMSMFDSLESYDWLKSTSSY